MWPIANATSDQTLRCVSPRVIATSLAANDLLQVLRIPRTVHIDLRCRPIDLPQVVRRELSVAGADVFLESMPLGCPGDRHDPRLLRQQPCQGDLRGRRVLPCGECLQPVDEGEIRLPV